MSLIRSKLENVVERADGSFNARCPACAARGGDSKGNHLIVFPDGKFGCVVFQGSDAETREHRALVTRLAGDGTQAAGRTRHGGETAGRGQKGQDRAVRPRLRSWRESVRQQAAGGPSTP
jgi:hypothetical protein